MRLFLLFSNLVELFEIKYCITLHHHLENLTQKSAAGKGDFQRVGKKWKHTPWAKYLTRTSIEIFDHKKVRFGKNSRNDQSLKKENKILCVFFLPSEFLSRSAIPSCPINQGWPPKWSMMMTYLKIRDHTIEQS